MNPQPLRALLGVAEAREAKVRKRESEGAQLQTAERVRSP